MVDEFAYDVPMEGQGYQAPQTAPPDYFAEAESTLNSWLEEDAGMFDGGLPDPDPYGTSLEDQIAGMEQPPGRAQAGYDYEMNDWGANELDAAEEEEEEEERRRRPEPPPPSDEGPAYSGAAAPADTLRPLPEIKPQRLLSEAEIRMEAKRRGDRTFLTPWVEGFSKDHLLERVPILGSVFEAMPDIRSTLAFNRLQKYNSGEYEYESDRQRLADIDFVNARANEKRIQNSRGTTFGGNVSELMIGSLQYMLDLVVTDRLFQVGRINTFKRMMSNQVKKEISQEVARQARRQAARGMAVSLKRLNEQVILNKIKQDFGTRIITGLGGSALQMIPFQTRVFRDVMDKMAPIADVGPDGKPTLVDPQKNLIREIARAEGKNYLEIVFERSGEFFDIWGAKASVGLARRLAPMFGRKLSKEAIEQAVKAPSLGKALELMRGKAAGETIRKAMNALAYAGRRLHLSSMPAEVAEEWATNFATSLLNLDDDTRDELGRPIPWAVRVADSAAYPVTHAPEVAAMFAGFGLINVVTAGVGMARGTMSMEQSEQNAELARKLFQGHAIQTQEEKDNIVDGLVAVATEQNSYDFWQSIWNKFVKSVGRDAWQISGQRYRKGSFESYAIEMFNGKSLRSIYEEAEAANPNAARMPGVAGRRALENAVMTASAIRILPKEDVMRIRELEEQGRLTITPGVTERNAAGLAPSRPRITVGMENFEKLKKDRTILKYAVFNISKAEAEQAEREGRVPTDVVDLKPSLVTNPKAREKFIDTLTYQDRPLNFEERKFVNTTLDKWAKLGENMPTLRVMAAYESEAAPAGYQEIKGQKYLRRAMTSGNTVFLTLGLPPRAIAEEFYEAAMNRQKKELGANKFANRIKALQRVFRSRYQAALKENWEAKKAVERGSQDATGALMDRSALGLLRRYSSNDAATFEAASKMYSVWEKVTGYSKKIDPDATNEVQFLSQIVKDLNSNAETRKALQEALVGLVPAADVQTVFSGVSGTTIAEEAAAEPTKAPVSGARAAQQKATETPTPEPSTEKPKIKVKGPSQPIKKTSAKSTRKERRAKMAEAKKKAMAGGKKVAPAKQKKKAAPAKPKKKAAPAKPEAKIGESVEEKLGSRPLTRKDLDTIGLSEADKAFFDSLENDIKQRETKPKPKKKKPAASPKTKPGTKAAPDLTNSQDKGTPREKPRPDSRPPEAPPETNPPDKPTAFAETIENSWLEEAFSEATYNPDAQDAQEQEASDAKGHPAEPDSGTRRLTRHVTQGMGLKNTPFSHYTIWRYLRATEGLSSAVKDETTFKKWLAAEAKNPLEKDFKNSLRRQKGKAYKLAIEYDNYKRNTYYLQAVQGVFRSYGGLNTDGDLVSPEERGSPPVLYPHTSTLAAAIKRETRGRLASLFIGPEKGEPQARLISRLRQWYDGDVNTSPAKFIHGLTGWPIDLLTYLEGSRLEDEELFRDKAHGLWIKEAKTYNTYARSLKKVDPGAYALMNMADQAIKILRELDKSEATVENYREARDKLYDLLIEGKASESGRVVSNIQLMLAYSEGASDNVVFNIRSPENKNVQMLQWDSHVSSRARRPEVRKWIPDLVYFSGFSNKEPAANSVDSGHLSLQDAQAAESLGWLDFQPDGTFIMYAGPFGDKSAMLMFKGYRITKKNRAVYLKEYKRIYDELVQDAGGDKAKVKDIMPVSPKELATYSTFETTTGEDRFNGQALSTIVNRAIFLRHVIAGRMGVYKNYKDIVKRNSAAVTPGPAPNAERWGAETFNILPINDPEVNFRGETVPIWDGASFLTPEATKKLEEAYGPLLLRSDLESNKAAGGMYSAKLQISGLMSDGFRVLVKSHSIMADSTYLDAVRDPRLAAILNRVAEYNKGKAWKDQIHMIAPRSASKLVPPNQTLNLFDAPAEYANRNTLQINTAAIKNENVVRAPLDTVHWNQELRHEPEPGPENTIKQLVSNISLYPRVSDMEAMGTLRDVDDVLRRTGGTFPEAEIAAGALRFKPELAGVAAGQRPTAFNETAFVAATSRWLSRTFRSRVPMIHYTDTVGTDSTLHPMRRGMWNAGEFTQVDETPGPSDSTPVIRLSGAVVGGASKVRVTGEDGDFASYQAAETFIRKNWKRYLDMFQPEVGVMVGVDGMLISESSRARKAWKIRTWEIVPAEEYLPDGTPGRWVIRGAPILASRIPATDLHSHVLARADRKIKSPRNFIVLPWEHAFIRNSDNDADKDYTILPSLTGEGKKVEWSLEPSDYLNNMFMLELGELYYDPKMFDRINSTLSTTYLDDALPKKTKKAEEEEEAGDLLTPYGAIELRKENLLGQVLLKQSAAMNSGMRFLQAHGVVLRESAGEGENIVPFDVGDGKKVNIRLTNTTPTGPDSPLWEQQSQFYSTILQLSADNVAELKLTRLGINEHNNALAWALIFANGDIKTQKDLTDYIRKVVTPFLNSPVVKAYVSFRDNQARSAGPVGSVNRLLNDMFGKDSEELEKFKIIQNLANELFAAQSTARGIYNPPTTPWAAQQSIENAATTFRGTFDLLDTSGFKNRTTRFSAMAARYWRRFNEVYHRAGATPLWGTTTGVKIRNNIQTLIDEGGKETRKKYRKASGMLYGDARNQMASGLEFIAMANAAYRMLPAEAKTNKAIHALAAKRLKELRADPKMEDNLFIWDIGFLGGRIQLSAAYQGSSMEDSYLEEVQKASDQISPEDMALFLYSNLQHTMGKRYPSQGSILAVLGPRFHKAWYTELRAEQARWESEDGFTEAELRTIINVLNSLGRKDAEYNANTINQDAETWASKPSVSQAPSMEEAAPARTEEVKETGETKTTAFAEPVRDLPELTLNRMFGPAVKDMLLQAMSFRYNRLLKTPAAKERLDGFLKNLRNATTNAERIRVVSEFKKAYATKKYARLFRKLELWADERTRRVLQLEQAVEDADAAQYVKPEDIARFEKEGQRRDQATASAIATVSLERAAGPALSPFKSLQAALLQSTRRMKSEQRKVRRQRLNDEKVFRKDIKKAGKTPYGFEEFSAGLTFFIDSGGADALVELNDKRESVKEAARIKLQNALTTQVFNDGTEVDAEEAGIWWRNNKTGKRIENLTVLQLRDALGAEKFYEWALRFRDMAEERLKYSEEASAPFLSERDRKLIRRRQAYILHQYQDTKAWREFSKRSVQDITRRQLSRKHTTLMQAYLKASLMPVTDAFELMERWQETTSNVIRNRHYITVGSVLTDALGMPAMIPYKQEGAIISDMQSIVSDSAAWIILENLTKMYLANNRGASFTIQRLKNPWTQINTIIRLLGDQGMANLGFKNRELKGSSLAGVWVQEGAPDALLKHVTSRGLDDIQNPGVRGVLKGVNWFNQLLKRIALFGSGFHFFALWESYVAAYGLNPLKNPTLNPFKGFDIPRLAKLYSQYKKDPNMIADASLYGLDVSAGINPNIQYDALGSVLDNMINLAGKTPVTAVMAGGPLRVVKQFKDSVDHFLWDVMQPTLKISSYVNMTEQAQQEFPDVPLDVIKQDVASYVNSLYGGLEYERYAWANPQVRSIMQLLMFAPDWTIAALNMSGLPKALETALGVKLPFSLVTETATPFQAHQTMYRYWPAFILLVMIIIPNMLQSAVYAMFGDPEEGDQPFTFNNEKGKEMFVDLTPIYRKMGEKYGRTLRRRVYTRWGKQGWEIGGWIERPVGQLLSKSSMAVKVAMEQLLNINSARWPMPWSKSPGPNLFSAEGDFTKGRLWALLKKLVPMNALAFIEDKPTNFFAPMTLGASQYGSIKNMVPILIAAADPASRTRMLSRRQTRKTMELLVKQNLDAAELNGYDRKQTMDLAISKARSYYYTRIFAELRRKGGPRDEVITKYMKSVQVLAAERKYFKSNLKRKFKATNLKDTRRIRQEANKYWLKALRELRNGQTDE